MKTQMRSRWEIFESTKDTRRQTSGQGESGRESRDGLVETAEKAKGSSDEEERREEHEQGGCAAGTPNVTRRCPYLFAIISARFHRFGHGTAQCGAVRRRDRARARARARRYVQKYYVGTYGIARRDGCTTIQAGICLVILGDGARTARA